MNALKRKSRHGKAYREYQEFMTELLNLMVRAYASELHQRYGFGAGKCTDVTEAVIKAVHGAIARYEGEYTLTALDSWCRDFGFDGRVGLDENGAVKFLGGNMKGRK